MSADFPDEYTTKELSQKTWPDLGKLFEKPGVGDAWWCWCTHHHVRSYSLPEHKRLWTRAENAVRNHREKRKLVNKGQSHGILVYAKGEPIGWCQYGPKQELPRVDNTQKYRKLALDNSKDKLWRITCFVVKKNYRRRGVASLALKAALEAIRKKGGGLIEAYPVSKTDQGSNYFYPGKVTMFEKPGFKLVGPLSNGRTATVVMQRTIRTAPQRIRQS